MQVSQKYQRGQRRVRVNRQFQPFRNYVRECIVDVSEHGAFIAATTPELPSMGSTVRLHHTIVTDRIETLEGVARVVRISESPRGVGVVFERLTADSQASLEDLLDPQTMRPIGGREADSSKLMRQFGERDA